MTNVNPFIVIEGNDACGKASVASFLGESLSAEVISFPRYASTSGQAVLSNLQGHWRCDVSEALFVAANSSDSTAADAAAYMAVARPHGMPLGAVVRQAIMTANRCEAHKALLAALARGMVVGDRYTPDRFIPIAANVECQVIRVPTGFQDYYSAQYSVIIINNWQHDQIIFFKKQSYFFLVN